MKCSQTLCVVITSLSWILVLNQAHCADDFDFDESIDGYDKDELMRNYHLYSSTDLFHKYIPKSTSADQPVIIWWTGRLFGGSDMLEIACPRGKCYSTADRKYLMDDRTRGFIFYGTDMEGDDLPLPRHSRHEWALYHEESPMNNFMLTHTTMLHLFNHTATFRRESDHPLTSQNILSIKYLTDRKPVSLEKKNNMLKVRGLAPVLYIQSHCDVASDRERYVEELMKYIQVDSVGTCLHNKDLPEQLIDPVENMEAPEFLDVIANYKFHLAFENAMCKDYMTEKLFRTLHVGSIPIHRGSPAAEDWMPNNNSLIMADHFASPKDLADHIQQINSDDSAYEKYLSYKNDGVTNTMLLDHIEKRRWGVNDVEKTDSFASFECLICDRLNDRQQVEKEHFQDASIPLLPPRIAATNHLHCPQPYTSIGHPDELPKRDGWNDMGWIQDYWNGLDKATAIVKMLMYNETDSSTFKKYYEKELTKRFGSLM